MMMRKWSALTLAFLAAVLTACGSGGSSSTSEVTSETPAAQTESATAGADATSGSEPGRQKEGQQENAAKPPRPDENPSFTPQPHHDSGGGSQQFKVKGGDNSIEEYGEEASDSEFSEAAEAVHGYLDARAAQAWAAACEYLSPAFRRDLVSQWGAVAEQKEAGCAAVIAALSALPPEVLREGAVADVAAFRHEKGAGFVLFHGAKGTAYFFPMKQEDGRWLVAAASPSILR
jgi:hypothetical protein